MKLPVTPHMPAIARALACCHTHHTQSQKKRNQEKKKKPPPVPSPSVSPAIQVLTPFGCDARDTPSLPYQRSRFEGLGGCDTARDTARDARDTRDVSLCDASHDASEHLSCD